jgi:hypothetical protein
VSLSVVEEQEVLMPTVVQEEQTLPEQFVFLRKKWKQSID